MTAAVLVGVAAAVVLRRALVRRRAAQHAAARRVALAELAAEWARALRSGATVRESAATPRAGALAGDLAALRARLDRGLGLDEALAGWAAAAAVDGDPEAPGVAVLVAGARAALRAGSDGAAALDGAARSLRDRHDLAVEAEALTAGARSSTAVLVALPPLGAATFALLDPAVAEVLLRRPVGWVCLGLGGGLDLAALAVSRRLVDAASGAGRW